MHIFGPVPPPPVGRRQGHPAIRRFGRFPEPPAVNNRDHPPPPPRPQSRSPPRQQSRSPPPPRVGGRSCGCQGRILVPSPALVTTLTPAKNTHRRPTLTPAQTYNVAAQFVVRQPFLPKLKCCHSNTTPSSRLPPAGRSGRQIPSLGLGTQ